jgi:hypothetical protein
MKRPGHADYYSNACAGPFECSHDAADTAEKHPRLKRRATARRLLRFVNTWGGVGQPGGVPVGIFEPVAWTRQVLKDLKELMELWSRVRGGKDSRTETLERLG